MSGTERKAEVDAYIAREKRWRPEMTALREIVAEPPLQEELKWGHPCYTFEGKNVVLIHGFKGYCALLFTKGALLSDPQGLMIQQTENVQSARQVRFTRSSEIADRRAILGGYVREAVEVERSGRKVEKKTTAEFAMPEQFRAALDGSAELKAAFAALTPGRQRGYLLHFAGAKQPKTRAARIEKHAPNILAGKGIDD